MDLVAGAVEFLTVQTFLLVGIGVCLGMFVGALPGLTVTMTMALLTSLTFSWPLNPALALMIGSYVGGVSAACIGAIFINIPGTPAAIATSFDGYPMTRRGEGGVALGVAAVTSFIATIIGTVGLAFAAPLISKFALSFGPPEYFFLVVMGLTLIASLAGDSVLRGLIAACLGIAIAAIGLDPIHGTPRLTFGALQLAGGIHFIPVVIGLLGLSEVLSQFATPHERHEAPKIGPILPRLSVLLKTAPVSIKGALIGLFIGSLPGVGGETASLVSYANARRSVKRPSRPFGEGAIEGVVASESANNSCIGGTWIPLLTLGLPGDSTTAVLLGALLIHGLRPGPLLLTENPTFLGYVVTANVVAALITVTLMLGLARALPRLVTLQKAVLLPVVIVLAVAGAFALQLRLFDVYVMLGFGFLGLAMRQLRIPVGPLVLGVILGGLFDVEMRRMLIMSRGDLFGFLMGRPISLALAAITVLMLLAQLSVVPWLLKRAGRLFPKGS